MMVATEIMGWCDPWTDGVNYMAYPPCEQHLGVGYDERHPIPNYSTEIEAAIEVINKMNEDGYFINQLRATDDIPKHIALAALKAKGVEVER
ncbi:MAG TPA: hypothetical protein DEF36_01775 [Desulfotomaculum sp.]|nr:hypothetical protein [Desulfotomaculum sp.]